MAGVVCDQLVASGLDLCQFGAVSQTDLTAMLEQYWDTVRETVRSVRDTLDPVIWLVGSILALVPGSFAIYRWWYYRKSRLPIRLQEYLQQTERRLQSDARTALHGIVSWRRPDAPLKTPVFVRPKLVRTMRSIGWARNGGLNSLDSATVELDDALKDIREQLLRVEEARALHRREEATAILIKGAIAAAQASKVKDEAEAIRLNREALVHFSQTVIIDPNELEALLYKAHQHRVLEEISEAIETYRDVQKKAVNGSVNSRNSRVDPEGAK